MFREEQVKAYKSITAPEEMKARVMSACAAPKKKSHKAVYRYSSIAACLAIIIAVSMIFGSMGGMTVSFNGQELTNEPAALNSAVAAASARTMSGITLEAEIDGKTEITTTDGSVYIYDSVSGELIEGEINAGKVTVIWDVVPTDTEKTYVLTFENSRGATEVTLLFNEAAGWMLCCDK